MIGVVGVSGVLPCCGVSLPLSGSSVSGSRRDLDHDRSRRDAGRVSERRGRRRQRPGAGRLLQRVAHPEDLRVGPLAADQLHRHRIAVRVEADRDDRRRQARTLRDHAGRAVGAVVRARAVVVPDVGQEARVDDRVDASGVHPVADHLTVGGAVLEQPGRVLVVVRLCVPPVRLYGRFLGDCRIPLASAKGNSGLSAM